MCCNKLAGKIIDPSGYKTISRKSKTNVKDAGTNSRIINIGLDNHGKFCSNKISTSKYNVLTFLPKFLFEQFRRYANVFFLTIAILQQFPHVSPTGRFDTAAPLLMILTVSAIKEIVEDYKRHKTDNRTNNNKIIVLRNKEWTDSCWRRLQVGDFVKLVDGQSIPADLVVLASSEPHGMSYIETSNLDGETNLKMRQASRYTSGFLTISDLDRLRGTLTCEPPNRHLYEFCGNICLESDDGDKLKTEKFSLNNDQVLLRGATLKNTKWIFGFVVYTGHETKVMMNSTAAPLKRSSLERMTNRYIIILVGLLVLLTVVTATANAIWTYSNAGGVWYLGFDKEAPNNVGLMLLTAVILLHNIIPISLQVTLEMVRFIQAHFINSDPHLRDSTTDTAANVRTSNLNEELGKVKYIFSDKTGTLTRNIMEFKQCSIAGSIYGHGAGDPDQSAHLDETLLHKIDSADQDVDMFFKVLSVCHTVVPEKDDHDEIVYRASSPDESALVQAARRFGYVFHTRTPEAVKINVRGEIHEFQVLNVLEFTSLRKRMSVVVRTADSRILLFTKGADNVIYERLSASSRHSQETLDHLEQFARIGLRTLCIAYAEIEPERYEHWNEMFHQVSIAIDNRDEKVAHAADLIEQNLILLGASAIEDKLQDEVPETISSLLQAGIKIWVLTGDKQETAINIGYSCQLLTQSMSLCVLDSDSMDKTRTQLQWIMQSIGDRLGTQNDIGFIITGETLKFALDFQCRNDFLQVALSCKAVICCRVSPSQKAEVVTLVKSNLKDAITLAIGDGANDVGMIQAAHVGVGISGLEGQQAACNSDYAIAQFRFLSRLLLVHGAWNQARLTKLVLYCFYKNVCFFLIQFWFAWLSGFSGQTVFDSTCIALYNVCFTAAPPLALGLFDRSCSAKNCLKYPQLYKEIRNGSVFGFKVFLSWIVNSIWHSLVIFVLTTITTAHDMPFSNGHTGSLMYLGTVLYTYVVVTVCLKAGLEHISWTWVSHLAVWGSIASWFLFSAFYWYLFQLRGISVGLSLMYQSVFSSELFWLNLILIPSAALTRDIVWKALNRTLFESLRERVMHMEKMNQDPDKVMPPVAATTTDQQTNKNRRLSLVGLRKMFRTSNKQQDCDNHRGFAFSQEEHGVIGQAQMVRHYNSTLQKPDGN